MNKDEFWSLIGKSKKLVEGNDFDAQAAIVESLLLELPPSDIVDFNNLYDEMRLESYDQKLWAAAYVINGGCSDDGFEYFRGWLISRGRQAFESALQDPGTLVAEIPSEDLELECEEMLYVARNAYEKKTGEEMPDGPALDWELKGEDWDEDKADSLFPELGKVADARWT